MWALLHNCFSNLCRFLRYAKSVLKNRISDQKQSLFILVNQHAKFPSQQWGTFDSSVQTRSAPTTVQTIRMRQQIHPNHKEFNPQLARYQI